MNDDDDLVAACTQRLVAALERDGITKGYHLTVRVDDDEAYVGRSDRWLVILAREGAGVRIQTPPPEGGSWQVHEVQSGADLDDCLPEIARSVEAWIGRLSVHQLKPGRRYRIVRDLVDIAGNEFAAGTVLTFEKLDVVPYHDGYTLHFAERGMWLQGGSAAYEQFGLYVVPA